MIKDIIEHNEEVKGNGRVIEILHRDFPQCFTTEGKFDLEVFQELVGEAIPTTHEGYSLQFLGKNYASLVATTDTTTVIVPDEEHNSKPENRNSKNIYISGDNIDALKHLRNSYAGAVKCIYIDPPYNTGSDGFVYNDRFNYTSGQLQSRLGISETAAERILEMTTKGSASHSAWLAFMFPRLLIARDLLTPDGVIFISIDDNEQANLKLLCDTIFGEENLVAIIPWQARASIQNDTDFSVNHEYIAVYARNRRVENRRLKKSNEDVWRLRDSFVCRPMPLDISKFDNPDNDPRGLWKADPFDAPHIRPNLTYAITNPTTGEQHLPPRGRCWRTDSSQYANALADNRIVFGNDGLGRPQLKVFYEEKKDYGSIDNSWFSAERCGTATAGTKELMKLFDGVAVFDTPKPTSLIKKLLYMANLYPEAIILDFFGGSGSTADAVMQWNYENTDCQLMYVMVQWSEETQNNSEARNAGFRTIDEIGQERIRRAAKKIKETHPLFAGDLGFKHYTLVEPSDQTFANLEEFNPKSVIASNTILDEFGRNTVLCTWALRDGYGLNAEITAIDLDGYKAYLCGRHLYFVDSGLGIEDNAKPIIALIDRYNNDKEFKPENVVLFGYSFTYTETEALKKNLLPLRDGIKNLKVNIDIRY